MKLYSIDQFDDKTDSEVDEILEQRTTKFIKQISDTLKGKHIEAFGTNGNGLWGQDPNLLDFEITRIKLTEGYVHLTDDHKYVNVAVDVYLKGYNDSKKYGMMYTDETAEKSFQKIFSQVLGRDAKLGWSEQGMQGDKYVNFDLSVPAKLLAPDLINYYTYQDESKKLKENLDAKLKKTKLKV